MTHELKKIFEGYINAQKEGIHTVLATVVDLDGSSYRRPGVRMLVLENGNMIGAVSGGCVEKEVLTQAEEVFKTGNSKLMTYDGRYRLGCEGVLYILLEVFQPDHLLIATFNDYLERRSSFEIISYYEKIPGNRPGIGSLIRFSEEKVFSVSGKENLHSNGHHLLLSTFTQVMPPCFKLMIIGAEHDAVQLCLFASLTGWEVTIVATLEDPKKIGDFPGAREVHALSVEELAAVKLDRHTAVMLMTHNFANDLKYLMALKDVNPLYIGLLGPADRREKLLSEFVEYCPEVSREFLESIHGPAGINIGGETPQEIAISIIAEILSIVRKQEPMMLSQKTGRIHS